MVPAMTWVTALLLDCWHCSPLFSLQHKERVRLPFSPIHFFDTILSLSRVESARNGEILPFFLESIKQWKERWRKKNFSFYSLELSILRINLKKEMAFVCVSVCVWRARTAGRVVFFSLPDRHYDKPNSSRRERRACLSQSSLSLSVFVCAHTTELVSVSSWAASVLFSSHSHSLWRKTQI